jgi:hypothetical protein
MRGGMRWRGEMGLRGGVREKGRKKGRKSGNKRDERQKQITSGCE